MPTPFKFFIKYCGNWSQLTPWMIGRRYLDGSEELTYREDAEKVAVALNNLEAQITKGL